MQSFRLSADREKALAWFFSDSEGAMGLRSNTGAILEVLAAGMWGVGGGGKAFDAMPDHAEGDRRRAWDVHRCVQRMQLQPDGVRSARVLYRAYGPAHWHCPYGTFRAELAPLIEYTPAVEALVRERPHLSALAAVETLLREARGAKARLIRTLEAQADCRLSAACRAYDAAVNGEVAMREAERPMHRVGRLLRCA